MTDAIYTGAIPLARAAPRGFISGPIYDTIFFIAAPLVALILGILIYVIDLSSKTVNIYGHSESATGVFIGTFIMAHLFAVFFRSNGNSKIFPLYPCRFTVVPIGWSEKKSMVSLFRLQNVGGASILTLLIFLGISFGYGFWAQVFDAQTVGTSVDFAWNAAIVVAIMHFWYDGFIWSVRKSQV